MREALEYLDIIVILFVSIFLVSLIHMGAIGWKRCSKEARLAADRIEREKDADEQ